MRLVLNGPKVLEAVDSLIEEAYKKVLAEVYKKAFDERQAATT
jgi:hypothetical protein